VYSHSSCVPGTYLTRSFGPEGLRKVDPETPNPKPQTLTDNPKPQTLNPKP